MFHLALGIRLCPFWRSRLCAGILCDAFTPVDSIVRARRNAQTTSIAKIVTNDDAHRYARHIHGRTILDALCATVVLMLPNGLGGTTTNAVLAVGALGRVNRRPPCCSFSGAFFH